MSGIERGKRNVALRNIEAIAMAFGRFAIRVAQGRVNAVEPSPDASASKGLAHATSIRTAPTLIAKAEPAHLHRPERDAKRLVCILRTGRRNDNGRRR